MSASLTSLSRVSRVAAQIACDEIRRAALRGDVCGLADGASAHAGYDAWCHEFLNGETVGLARQLVFPRPVRDAIAAMGDLFARAMRGDEPTLEQWRAANGQAVAAASLPGLDRMSGRAAWRASCCFHARESSGGQR